MISPHHILITGASSGIGAALAIAYAAPGVRLSLLGRDSTRLLSVQAKAEAKGALVTSRSADVRDAEKISTWVAECERLQPIDLVIANAGISAGTGSGLESTAQTHAIFETNLTGVLNTVQPVLPILLQRRRGQVAIISSLAGFRGMSGAAAYCGSKAAVRVYGEALRSQCLPHGVSINIVCPGFIKTPMTDVNRFPMPFIMSPERAASIIRDELYRDKPRIAFPFILYALIRLLGIFPQSWLDKPLGLLPKKGS